MAADGTPAPPGVGATPSAEVDVTVSLVHDLLAQQHPDLADSPPTVVANGWDNVIVRVGDDLVARFPRRRLAAGLVAGEQRWLPGLAAGLPIPIATPVRTGRPGLGYPWAWSICRWFDGEVAADVRLADPGHEAERLGRFVHALHRPAPAEAPANPFRGQPVAELVPRIRANLARLFPSPTPSTSSGTYSAILALIDQLATTPEWTGPPLWLHGDLHTANLVVADGAIAAVIDFGDLTSGDPAVDLAVAWMLFDGDDRARFRGAAGGGTAVDDDTWARARLWELHFALLYLLHSADNERFARMGHRLLDAVLSGG
ncbi:aminoglycoside phosphotransferase family protein [Tessaracoccus defluvii]|uniref:Aminoglycoside phosphotransferase family protein n=2 Tax=Tessaracoccus defluvii TaxID=1285901 RepID=A0A7H0HAH3_9ACTN|nr:aminoglycoside phosphotransferase family protein [Tessaracoccus defluvii]